MDRTISFAVNGQEVTVQAHPETPLVSVLRWRLDLRGVRAGCGIGVCGVCTVLVDGQATKSCITPVGAVADKALTTPEGLGTPDAPGPVQAAFLEEQAAQCGYCINGIIMTVESCRLRGEGVEQLHSRLSEHLCRCCTHHRILRAARRAVGETATVEVRHWDHRRGHATVESASAAPSTADIDDARVESRLALRPDGRVEVFAGKVEIGQGILSALAQIAASQLRLPLECVVVRRARTGAAPDEGNTSGSRSVQDAGTALAAAAAAFRRLLLERAAAELAAPMPSLALQHDRVVSSSGAAVSLASLAADGPICGDILPTDEIDWQAPPLDEPTWRSDLLPKLTGAPAFLHDLALPDMLHARAVLPDSPDMELAHADVESVRRMPGVVRVILDGRLLLVVARGDDQAARAVTELRRSTSWEDPARQDGPADVLAILRSAEPTQTHVAAASAAPDFIAPSHRATYTRPYQAHAPVAPSCAVARQDERGLQVWTHSQSVYGLRRELAALFGEEVDDVRVAHLEGPGCYGQTLADDAAAFAATAARALPGAPVRFQFSVEDEFVWDPLGPPMLADMAASLTASGTIAHWRHHTRTDTHNTRPGGSGDDTIVAWLRENGTRPPWRGATEAGARNAKPIYAIPEVDAVAVHVQGPLRTGALRSLGAYLNAFAAESFMDELAGQVGQDPLAFRLAHLEDERARQVLTTAAELAGWRPHVGPSGRGIGLALCRYKNDKAYVAQAVLAEVDPATARVHVERIWVVCDAGTVIDPSGARNQLEGGTLQALSRALHEEVGFDGRGRVRTRDWSSYPVLGFDAAPEVDVTLIDGAGNPPLGIGEAALPALPAALANAIDDACGVRLRDLPFTPERIGERVRTISPRHLHPRRLHPRPRPSRR